MTLTGRQKAHLLLSLLGSDGQKILSELPKNYASVLLNNVQDAPSADHEDKADLLQEIMHRLEDAGVLDSLGTIISTPKPDHNYQPHADADLGLDDAFSDDDHPESDDAETESSQDDDDILDIDDALGMASPQASSPKLQKVDEGDPDSDVLSDHVEASVSSTPVVDVQELALRLSSEKPQIIAFYLSRQASELRDQLELALPGEVMDQVKQVSVESVPISSSVYDYLHAKLTA